MEKFGESVRRVGLGEEDAQGGGSLEESRGGGGRGHVSCQCPWAKREISHWLWGTSRLWGTLRKYFWG